MLMILHLGASLYVFCDLKHISNCNLQYISLGANHFVKQISKNYEVAPLKNLVLQENDRYLRFFICSTDDNVLKSLTYVGNYVN